MDDFCLTHGRDHMRWLDGCPIPYCEKCDVAEKIEDAMGDLVDLLAAHPDIEIDERAWRQLLIYAPKFAAT